MKRGWLLAMLWLAACTAQRAASPATSPALAVVTASPSPLSEATTEIFPTTASVTTVAPATPTTASPPTPTAPPAPRQLTTGGCCVQPFWSPDGAEVWYIDRPSALLPSGIWGVPATGGEPHFITERLGLYSPDRSLYAYPEAGQTYVERSDGSERWVVPSGGRAISYSPDGTQIAWQEASSSVAFDRRSVEIWISGVDGTNPRRVAVLIGGGFSGWFPDGAHLLINGREPSADGADQQFLAALDLADGSTRAIVTVPQLRGAQLSPAGGWLAYLVAFSGDPESDGLWVASSDGSGARKLELFGAYRWRTEGRLLVIPLEAGAGGQRLVEVDAQTGAARGLTDPALTALPIAGGDWSVSPDGTRIVFVNATDHNLWLLDLPK